MISVQLDICKEYNADYLECDTQLISGVADTVREGMVPINGLRHPQENGTTGWYIRAGENLETGDDFFKSMHTTHLIEKCPEVEKYLGLAPGWRFLINPVSKYVDVWYDDSLLETSD